MSLKVPVNVSSLFLDALTPTNSQIQPGDSISEAFGKTQGQINSIIAGGGSGAALPYFYGFKILPDTSLSFEKSLLSDSMLLDVNAFDDYFISTLNLNYSIENGDLILSQGV